MFHRKCYQGNWGEIAEASGTNARTGGTFVPLTVTQLKYALPLKEAENELQEK